MNRRKRISDGAIARIIEMHNTGATLREITIAVSDEFPYDNITKSVVESNVKQYEWFKYNWHFEDLK